MDLATYVAATARTAGPTRPLSAEESQFVCMALGLAGEAGEFADKAKKLLFHDHPVSPAEFTKELGDIAWYWARVISSINELFDVDVTAGMVLEQNVEKLMTRYPEGFSSEASLARVDVAA